MKLLFGRVFSSVLLLTAPVVASAQPSGPRPERPYLFVLDLQGTALDEFPSSLKALTGVMTVVDKNGQHLLKASSPSEFLITLPQALPADFTVELDVIPKGCCAPDDIMLEGTPTRNRGVASVELTWHPERVSAVGGGGEMYQSETPADLAASTPGNLTHLVVVFQGTQIKLYTNGRRLYTLDKQFARGRVLRVALGGADEGLNAAYLASFRIGLGAASPTVIAGGAAAASGVDQSTSPPAATDPTTNSESQSLVGGSNRVVSNVAVSMGAGGPLVTWDKVGGASSYSVQRSKLDDATCCNRTSPALSGLSWQDGPLPAAGTYVFLVTAILPSGVATGQAQFVQFKSSGQIATVAPAPAPAAPSPPSNPAVASGIRGTTTGGSAPTSPVKYFLPPPPRSIDVVGITAAGVSSSAASRTIVLGKLSAAGVSQDVAPRAIALPAITAAGPVITIARTLLGTNEPQIPAPRSISLATVSAAGIFTGATPRSVNVAGLTAAGIFQGVGPRTVKLVGWTAVGANP